MYNFDGYYDLLLKWFAVVIRDGFTTPMGAGVLSVIRDLEDLETCLATYSFIPPITHDLADLAPTAVTELGVVVL